MLNTRSKIYLNLIGYLEEHETPFSVEFDKKQPAFKFKSPRSQASKIMALTDTEIDVFLSGYDTVLTNDWLTITMTGGE